MGTFGAEPHPLCSQNLDQNTGTPKLMMHTFFSSAIVIGLVLSAILLSTAAGEETIGSGPLSFVHPHQEPCVACHLEGVDEAKLLASAGDECLQCHDRDQIGGKPSQRAQSQPDNSNKIEELAHLSAVAELAMPIYYEESRAANPTT